MARYIQTYNSDSDFEQAGSKKEKKKKKQNSGMVPDHRRVWRQIGRL